MALHTDLGLGIHQAWRRRLTLQLVDIGISGAIIPGGGSVVSNLLHAPGFTHFAGVLAATTPIATTLQVRVIPQISFSLASDEFIAATIATFVGGPFLYPFYWGEARGLLTASGGSGSTFVMSWTFRLRVADTGANAASVSVEQLEIW